MSASATRWASSSTYTATLSPRKNCQFPTTPSACAKFCASLTPRVRPWPKPASSPSATASFRGGRYFDGPALITDEIRNLIEELCPLAPLHNPAHLKGIDVARELMPDVPHVAVFDTAFFQQLPARSALYALETETAEKYSVRRYGAHGTSHQFVSQEIAKLEGRDDLKQIVLHLGNGASVSAVKNGKPIDTSMGLTPLEAS